MRPASEGFGGTKRFVVEARLGSGAMGVVHRVRDLQRAEVVALKTMGSIEPEPLLRFKKEFRALADISHPNVVQLYELFSDADQWFFTMELLDGVDLLTWIQRDKRRLRDAFRQLAAGLVAIHRAGKLHRDVKPQNVMVTPSGRVVLFDFGVVSDLADRTSYDLERSLVGTPAYMAPEQGTLARGIAASDWYAVGIMLYQALTHRLPCEPLVPPSAYAEAIPEDLERLVMDLLEEDPRARPTGEQVLACLEGESEAATGSAPSEPRFVGRRAELEALRAAFAASAERPVVVMLHGRSGMGKTALASRFIAELFDSDDTLVLSGRCYEREAVPFRAIDPVVDELRHWLSQVPISEVGAFLPVDLSVLAGVFPVLTGVATTTTMGREHAAIEPPELRRRAFAALSELLTRISRHRRLVVHIDDLQWCDADSVHLLVALLNAPSLRWLLVGTYRSETGSCSEPLVELRNALAKSTGDYVVHDVEVAPLGAEEALELGRTLVGAGGPAVASLVTAEACGSPLFLAELARWANEHQGTLGDAIGLSLDRVILDRVARLPDDARSLLETLSVASGPLTHSVAARAAGRERRLRPAALALRSARLVVTRGLGDDDAIEPAHDRVREAVAQSLTEARRRECHAGIARALAADQGHDPEAVFEHWSAAGDLESARTFVMAAADASARSLAFVRAAALYRSAIDLRAAPLDVLHTRLGDALANAGRLADAADAYHAGAAHARPTAALELCRLAADHYLKSGRTARGLEVLRAVLDEVGLAYPRSTTRAVASLLFDEAKLRVAPLRRRLRPARIVRSEHLAQIDVAFAAATGLSMSDPLRGADFASRGLLLALDAGEPFRLCRALAVAAGNAATPGEGARSRAEQLVRQAERIAREIDDPRAWGHALLAAGTVDFFFGEWRSARSKLERADEILRERCRAVAWELANTRSWTCNVLILSGQLAEASLRAPALMDEARSRDDRFAMMHLVYPACVARIVADDVPGARAVASLGETGDPNVLTAGTWGAFISAGSVERYCGDAAAAWQRVRAGSASLERSLLWRSAMVRAFSNYERGLSAIAAASAGHDRRRALRAADRWANDLANEKLRYAPALSFLLRSGARAVRGDLTAAMTALDSAIPRLEQADLGYLAACARHRRGALLGGALGRQDIDRTRAFFAAQGIVNAERCLAMSAPGFAA